ncbi:MAG: hypothetical protein ACR2K6_00855 [Solirubrobacterales bacterium]
MELDAGRLLEELRSGQVDFIIVGGMAVGAHGHPRATNIDIVPDPETANLKRLAAVLDGLDYQVMGAEDFDPEEVVQPDLDGLRGGGSWVLLTKFGRLDILQHLEPSVDYRVLAGAAIEDEVFGVAVTFCGYEHLIEMKRAAGRPQDLLDIDRLEQLRGVR